jgi:hypothetical protein
MHTSRNKSLRKRPRNLSNKIAKKRLQKITNKENREELKQALRTTPNRPTLSQNLTMKLSS